MSVREPGQFRPVLKALKQQGWTWSRTGKGHRRFVSPEGRVVIASGTPRSSRSLRNLQADLRRRGFQKAQ